MKDELATKKDLQATQAGLEKALKETRTDLETAIKETRTDLETAIKETKTELQSAIIETKNDLQGQINVLNWKTDQLDDKLSNFRNETGEKLDTIITAVDGLAKLITDGQTEKVAVNSALYRLEDRAENHERRIGILETKI